MSGERIKAGEAYVLVTCDNNNLKNGLQEVVRSVDEAAREISAKEKELSPTVKIDPEPVKKAIDEALAKAREVANRIEFLGSVRHNRRRRRQSGRPLDPNPR